MNPPGNMLTIDKSPTNTNTYSENLYFSSSCRVGFGHLLRNLGFQREKILLPSYIGWSVNEGSGVFDPIVEHKFAYEFYKIKHDLSTDLEDLKSRLAKGNVKAVLLIHYFGFLQSDLPAIVKLCQEYHTLLIEDCAHTLTSIHEGRELGCWGDFGLYSLHKVLPVTNGGMLRINNPDFFSIPAMEEKDRISKETLELFCGAKLKDISTVKRNNYLSLANLLNGVDEIEVMYSKLPDGIVPQTFPILLKSISRENAYFAMINKGVRVIALYYKLIDQISEKDFPVSYDISRRILNLPIHQDLTYGDMQFIAERMLEVLHDS